MLIRIREWLSKWRDESKVGLYVFVVLRKIIISVMSILPDEQYAKWFYKFYTRKTLHLDDPKTFNEKLWWLKIYNHDPLMTKCSDKHLAREYVRDCGYEDILIPQVGVYDSVKEIDFSLFRQPTILKGNHCSGGHVLYDPSKAETFSEKTARRTLRRALRQNYYWISREWNYKDIPRKIVAEKIIRDSKGELPRDYRFFCFDGEPKLLMMDVGVIDDRGRHQYAFPRNIYDMDFQRLPIRWGRDSYDGPVEKPENFERMKEIARKLSEPFALARVDLYNLDGKIYFGEITFYHGGACQPIEPEEWDLRMAEWIDLNSPKIVRKTGK